MIEGPRARLAWPTATVHILSDSSHPVDPEPTLSRTGRSDPGRVGQSDLAIDADQVPAIFAVAVASPGRRIGSGM